MNKLNKQCIIHSESLKNIEKALDDIHGLLKENIPEVARHGTAIVWITWGLVLAFSAIGIAFGFIVGQ